MDQHFVEKVIKALDFKPYQVKAVLEMTAEGDTVPFIARYRKERTGSLDEVQIREIKAKYQEVDKLEKRKQAVLKAISEENRLSDGLKRKILSANDLQAVEDLYLPYKKKRQTKAQKARQAGLEPLAKILLTFGDRNRAQDFVSPAKGIRTAEDALAGAGEIMAEAFGESAQLRQWTRAHFWRQGKLVSKLKPKNKGLDETGVYENYYDFSAAVKDLEPYQILALNRGEKEKILQVRIDGNDDYILHYLHSRFIYSHKEPSAQGVEAAYTAGYRRFIKPAIEREIRNKLTEQADKDAIQVFGNNLYHLLMQAPLKGRVVMGFDPAFRTGCKLAVVDPTGKFLTKAVIYPHEKTKGGHADPKLRQEAQQIFLSLIEKYQVEVIAIGNGTASRESQQFVAETVKKAPRSVHYVVVNEAGASVYSASSLAREEFPDLNVEERSAISIARRLQDPLAELIKIDPQAIGVGQYQHDLPKKELSQQVDNVIETSVNQVGVNVNTASPQLLEHVSGLNKTISNNIVAYRNKEGRFLSRNQLKQVPRLGPKAFEQSAGFMRIVNGNNILDNTDIHPESYAAARKLIKALGFSLDQVGSKELNTALQQANPVALAAEFNVGKETLQSIIASLQKPGRDQRDQMPAPLLRSDVLHIQDLKPGMKLEGTVRNVVDFGAFVDIGVKQDGLVHISRMSHNFVKNPRSIVSVGDIVDVWVVAVDLKRSRIQLSFLPVEEADENE